MGKQSCLLFSRNWLLWFTTLFLVVMADITMCRDQNCPVKEKCYRFTANPGMMQSYFLDIPGKIEDGKFTCDMYWGENAESVWNQLKDITNGKDNSRV